MNAKSFLKYVSGLKYSLLGIGLVLVVAVSAVLVAQSYIGGADDSGLNSVISRPIDDGSGALVAVKAKKATKKRTSAEEKKFKKDKARFTTNYAKFQAAYDKLQADLEAAFDNDADILAVAEQAVNKTQVYCNALSSSFTKSLLKGYKTSLKCGNLVSDLIGSFNEAQSAEDAQAAEDFVLEAYDELAAEFEALKAYVDTQ